MYEPVSVCAYMCLCQSVVEFLPRTNRALGLVTGTGGRKGMENKVEGNTPPACQDCDLLVKSPQEAVSFVGLCLVFLKQGFSV